VVGKKLRFLGTVTGLVVMADRYPQHDVAAVDGVERAGRVQLLKLAVVAMRADFGALLHRVAAVDRHPDVSGAARVDRGQLR